MANTKTINNLELQVGNIVHAYGARFAIVSTRIVEDREPDNSGPIMSAMGKWLDGRTETGYFGPTCSNWNFQGNRRVSVTIEIVA